MTASAYDKPTPPFKRGRDNVLVEALNKRQIRCEREWTRAQAKAVGL